MAGDRSVRHPSDADISFCFDGHSALFSPHAHHSALSCSVRLLAVGRPGPVVCRAAAESVGVDERSSEAVVEEDLCQQELRGLQNELPMPDTYFSCVLALSRPFG